MTAVSTYSPINEMLPTEILGLVFEEHTLLHWNAPVVDGLVCRLWRQLILHTPGAWSRIAVRKVKVGPSVEALRLWLDRAKSSPLHLQFEHDSEELQRLVAQYHTSISYLLWSCENFKVFDDRSFPNLRCLHITSWRQCSPKFGAMERLEHLNLVSMHPDILDIKRIPPLKSITARYSYPSQLLQHSQATLTSLILKVVHIYIPTTLDLPNLRYLSVFEVTGIRPIINASRLEVFYESDIIMGQWFSTPMPSVIQYSTCHTDGPLKIDAATLYPNIRFLALRLFPRHVVEYLKIFDSQEFENGDRLSKLEVVELRYAYTPSNKFSTREATLLRERMQQIIEKRERGSGLKLQIWFRHGGPFSLPMRPAEVRPFRHRGTCISFSFVEIRYPSSKFFNRTITHKVALPCMTLFA